MFIPRSRHGGKGMKLPPPKGNFSACIFVGSGLYLLDFFGTTVRRLWQGQLQESVSC